MGLTNLDTLVLSVPLAVASISTTLTVQSRSHTMATVATTGTTEVLFRAPFAGTVSMVSFIGKDALAQATALVTFSLTNKGAAGVGTTALLAAVDANSTKVSTGAPVLAYTAFTMTLSATPANLVVAKGDILAFAVAVSGGTLSNTITEGLAVVEFTPS